MVLIRIFLGAMVAMLSGLTAIGQIQSIGIAGDGEFTRITVTSDTSLQADVFMGHGAAGRIFQLIPDTYALGNAPYFGEPTGGIEAYTLDRDRIVFELEIPMMIVRELDLPPTGSETRHRFILDLSRVSEARFDQGVKRDNRRLANRLALPSLAAPVGRVNVVAEAPSPKPAELGEAGEVALLRRHVVVIDPGHGGRDPGAIAVTGGYESSVVLKTAQALKAALEKEPRYEVRLTRETDVYVEHEDRVSMARDWGADLFISLHADAAAKADVSGASVYTISTRGERRIEGTANKYGWELPIEDGTSDDVSGILEELIKRETKSNSAIFAELVVPELAQAGPLLRNTHRQKNLFVLLAPDVPAVLIEIGFLTNRGDAKRLKSSRGRKKSAAAIKRAIDAYFDRQDLRLSSN
ncbi:MAG: N-acetylmuramoyl-L-alanine amidase [Henriciella sp.]|nr:N-acetylmuramoyl-L-alanine amidase [Henriciella sp.]